MELNSYLIKLIDEFTKENEYSSLEADEFKAYISFFFNQQGILFDEAELLKIIKSKQND